MAGTIPQYRRSSKYVRLRDRIRYSRIPGHRFDFPLVDHSPRYASFLHTYCNNATGTPHAKWDDVSQGSRSHVVPDGVLVPFLRMAWLVIAVHTQMCPIFASVETEASFRQPRFGQGVSHCGTGFTFPRHPMICNRPSESELSGPTEHDRAYPAILTS